MADEIDDLNFVSSIVDHEYIAFENKLDLDNRYDFPHSIAADFSDETNNAIDEMIRSADVQKGDTYDDDFDIDVAETYEIFDFAENEEMNDTENISNAVDKSTKDSSKQNNPQLAMQTPGGFKPSEAELTDLAKFRCEDGCLVDVPANCVLFIRRTLQHLTQKERHIYLLGRLQRELPWKKESNFVQEYYLTKDIKVCKMAFCFACGIAKDQLQRLKSILYSHGIEDKPHGSKGRSSNAAIESEEIIAIKHFILNKAHTYGRYSPMAISKHEPPPIYFPSGTQFILMYKDYHQMRIIDGGEPVFLNSFSRVWRKDLPYIEIQTRRTDVCNTCDFLVNELAHGNGDELTNYHMRQKLNCHCDLARASREYYETNRENVLKVHEKYGIENETTFSADAEDSVRMIAYDFAQLSMIPHNTDQRNSLYFKVPLKMQKFGIVEEGPRSNTYFIFDEGSTVEEDGKGTHAVNAVLSFIHHYHTQYKPLKGNRIIAQADNCVGQNKNKFVFWYYAFLIVTGQVEEVELHFLQVGHTKFPCDLFFGLLSKKFNQVDVTTPKDFRDIGNSVSKSTALLYGEDGETWQWYNWRDFLTGSFVEIPGLTKFYYYRLYRGEDDRVMVACRKTPDGESVLFSLSTEAIEFDQGPEPLQPNGLSTRRADYLVALKGHARADKRDEFVARINATRNTVSHPVPQDEGVLEESEEPTVEVAAVTSVTNTVSVKQIIPEIRPELKDKKAETGWSLKDLQKWLADTYNIHVVAKTVSNHLNKKD